MTFRLKQAVANVLLTREADIANEAMRRLTNAENLPINLVQAKLDLQRTLFELVPHAAEEEKEQP